MGLNDAAEMPIPKQIDSPNFNDPYAKKTLTFQEDDEKILAGDLTGYFDPDDDDDVNLASGGNEENQDEIVVEPVEEKYVR